MPSATLLWRPICPADPVRTYYVLNGVATFSYTLAFTVNLVYMILTVGLDPLQLVLVGTVLEATCFLFEVPTGVVADRYSRRLSVLIGFVLIGAGFLVGGSLPVFGAQLVAQVVWGIGYTFTSGATVAWITDEIGEEAVHRVFTREQQIHLVAAFAGTVCAGALSLIDVRLPIALSGLGFLVLAIGLALRMPERNFAPALDEERRTLASMLATTRAGLRLARARPVVRGVLVVSLLVGLSSEGFDRLWQLQVIDHPFPAIFGADSRAAWFAAVALVGIVLSLAASLLVNRFGATRLAGSHPGQLLAGLAAVEVLGVLGVALAPWTGLALAAFWAKGAAGVIAAPVLTAWLNRNVESGIRATVLSFNSQADAVGQVVGGPPLGIVAGRATVRLALVVSAGLLAPTVPVFAVLGRRMLRGRPAGSPGRTGPSGTTLREALTDASDVRGR